MGLPNFQQYSLTKHFKQRALERFGIPEEKCLKWFRVQAQTMELCDNPNNKDPHQQRFQNADNIIMICNTENRTARTCFSSSSCDRLLYEQFQADRKQLIATYRTELVGKESDDILQSLETLLRMTNEARLKMSVVSTEWMNDFNASLHQLQSNVETMQRHLNLFN